MHRTHLITAVAAALGLVAGCWIAHTSTAQAAYEPEQNGRYQVVGAAFTVKIAGKNEDRVEQGVFKIDTATGEGWRYAERYNETGEIIRTWVRITPR